MSPLPSTQRVIVDVIEWYAHSVFLEDSNELDIFNATEQLCALCHFAIPELERSGRIWNRIILVNLVHNICTRKTTADEAEALIHLGPQDWESMLESLETCRASLIKMNANTYPPEGYDKEDGDKIHLPMFTEVYQDVYELLECHLVIAQFRRSLKTSSSDDIHSIIDEYTQTLPKRFQDTDLVKALRMDVLSSPTRKHNVVEKILQGVWKQLQTTGKSYSYDQVQAKVKRLARVWNESILGIPTMVQLGYGGIRIYQTDATGGGDDHKTVSSFGMDEEEQERATAAAVVAAKRKELNLDHEGEANEGSEEYHTADEHDDGDAGSLDGYNVPKKRKMKTGAKADPIERHQSLQVRPRQSWREDYSLIDDLQKVGEEDDAPFPAEDEIQKNDADMSKVNIFVGNKLVWTDSGDDEEEEEDDTDDDDDDEEDYHKSAAQRKMERRQRQERRKAADLELHKPFLETDDDGIDDLLLDGRAARPMVVRKLNSFKPILEPGVPHQDHSNYDSSSEDENLPPFLRSLQISPKLPTYAEYMKKKKDAATAALREQEISQQHKKVATSSKENTRSVLTSGSKEKQTSSPRKRRRRHFFNKRVPAAAGICKIPE